MNFEPLASILKKRYPQAQFSSAYVVSGAQAVIGERGIVRSYKEGLLKIEAADGQATELLMAQELLRQQINDHLGQSVVSRIIVIGR